MPEAMTRKTIIHSDPEILGGTPVFFGTRVPVQSLFDYLEGGETLDEFLHQFPSVKRDQALAALEIARDSLLASALSVFYTDESMALKRSGDSMIHDTSMVLGIALSKK